MSVSRATHGAAKVLRRSKDPLLSAAHARHYALDEHTAFIVREPDSPLPVTLPIPSTSRLPSTNPFGSRPSLFLTTDTKEHLVPSRAPSIATVQLSEAEVLELQALRRADPVLNTRNVLARKFNISPQVVGRLGWGTGSVAAQAEKSLKAQIAVRKAGVVQAWGWKKAIAREERGRRRALW